MSYEDNQIRDIVDELNRSIFLPDIQREFVWTPDQITKLFDSLMSGYPIGSFLFWKIKEDHKNDWTVYEFIKDYDSEFPHNKEANISGVHKDVSLVLDGQQRLTSLFIGLKGYYRFFYYQWKKTKLYLNLFKNPQKSENPDVLTYQFEFREDENTINSKEEFWYEVSNILRYKKPSEAKKDVQEILAPYDKELIINADNLIDDLFHTINTARLISYYEEKDQDYDKVVEIFVRANTGGKKLEYSDILLSKATAKWDRLNAREELNSFTDNINKIGNGYSFDKDFVLKGCLYLTKELPIKYKVANFTKENLRKIEDNWENIKKFIEDTIKLLYKFGMNDKNITSASALLPIAYYLIKTGEKNYVNSSSKEIIIDQNNIRIWLTLAFLKNVFGGSSDNVLNITRDVLNNNTALECFPYKEINNKLKVESLLSDLEVKELLESSYRTRYSFSILSILYPDRDWKDNKYQEDHIFPKSEFTKAKLAKRKYNDETIKKYLKEFNNIANLQLLTDSENNEKKAKDFSKWINTRDSNFKLRHSIPELSSYDFDNFIEFINERKKIIEGKLKSLLYTD